MVAARVPTRHRFEITTTNGVRDERRYQYNLPAPRPKSGGSACGCPYHIGSTDNIIHQATAGDARARTPRKLPFTPRLSFG
jgi:hypothetical protein